MSETKASPLLVIGAGIAGVTAALEAAEMGSEVVLVEQDPAIGGRVLRITNYFPKLCPPSCGMEINTRRLEKNPRIRVMTSTKVTNAMKTDSGWAVTVTTHPRTSIRNARHAAIAKRSVRPRCPIRTISNQ